MRTVVAIAIAFATGLVARPMPDPVVPEPEIERMFTPRQELFLRHMCAEGGCTMVPTPKLNEMTRQLDRCRA